MPCLLCGQIHRLRVHAKLVRKIRTGDEKNTVILIISIYCIIAEKRGLQYTKRILPPFVIPECNIILEYVLKYIALYPDDLIPVFHDVQIFPGDQGGQMENTAAQTFADDQQIRNQVEVLAGKHFSGAPETVGDFIQD